MNFHRLSLAQPPVRLASTLFSKLISVFMVPLLGVALYPVRSIAAPNSELSVQATSFSPEYFGPMPHHRSDTYSRANATVGRYLYVGDAPRFEAKDLEMYTSKMGLTLRIKAWVSEDLV